MREPRLLFKDGRTVVCGCEVVIEEAAPCEYLIGIPKMEERDEVPSLWINHYPGFLRLSSLFVPVPFRRMGCARALVNEAVRASLRVGLPIYLDALPYADRPLALPQLLAFYESCGFRRFPGHPTAMVFDPEGLKRRDAHSAGSGQAQTQRAQELDGRAA